MSVEEVMQPVLADRIYYEESGGGVTLTGGEPVLQWEFAQQLLIACKDEGISTTLQTAGNYPYEHLLALLPYTDTVMFDLKALSKELYVKYIHADREQILSNLQSLNNDFQGELIVRTPCIGTVNDSREEIESIAKWLTVIDRLHYYRLIPYHGMAKSKYDALGLTFSTGFATPSADLLDELERVAAVYVPVFSHRGYMI